MTGVEVRLAEAGDVEEIVRLEREAERAPHWAEVVYREIVSGDGMRCLYVACGAGVLGFGVGRVVGDFAEIESLAVQKHEQGRGVGRALLEAVMEWCVARGARQIELEVREGGAAARRLYQRVGFMEVGRRLRYYGEPVEDAVLMRWAGGDEAGAG